MPASSQTTPETAAHLFWTNYLVCDDESLTNFTEKMDPQCLFHRTPIFQAFRRFGFKNGLKDAKSVNDTLLAPFDVDEWLLQF